LTEKSNTVATKTLINEVYGDGRATPVPAPKSDGKENVNLRASGFSKETSRLGGLPGVSEVSNEDPSN
jgi:hypothetical protein